MAKYGLTDKQIDISKDREYFDLHWATGLDYDDLMAGKTIHEASYHPCAYSKALDIYHDSTIEETVGGLAVEFITITRILATDFLDDEVKAFMAKQVTTRGSQDEIEAYFKKVRDMVLAERQLIETAMANHPDYDQRLRLTPEAREARKVPSGQRRDDAKAVARKVTKERKKASKP